MARNEVPEGQNFVEFYGNLYRSYLRRNEVERSREMQNWGIFGGVNHAQWDPDQLAMLIEERRAPHQINFTQQKVNSLLGNILQNELETEYVPADGQPSDETLTINGLFLTDKDRTQWAKHKRLFKRAGLVYRGTGEMYIDYKADPQGAVGFRFINNNRVMFDPDWRTDNINDNKHIIQWAWMDPEEIKLVYNKSTQEIENAIKIWRQSVATRQQDLLNGGEELAEPFMNFPEFVDILNNRYLVIQTQRLDRISVDRLFDMEKQTFLPEMSPENMQVMMRLRGKALKVLRDKVGIVRVTTVAPGLSLNLKLEDSDHPVQIGRYPYFTWSYMNINGQPQGVVDSLKDLQQIYNKRESNFTHWQTTANNGSEFVEENFFANATEKDRYIDEKNIPGGTYTVSDGSLSRQGSGISTRPREAVPNDLHTSADRALNMVSEVTPVVPALQGGEGKSGESGKLFSQKRAQALVSIEPMMRSLEDFEHEFGEAYLLLAKNLYSGSPRKVFNPETKQDMLLNIPTNAGQIMNNMRNLRRHNVRINKSKRGVTVREELLNR